MVDSPKELKKELKCYKCHENMTLLAEEDGDKQYYLCLTCNGICHNCTVIRSRDSHDDYECDSCTNRVCSECRVFDDHHVYNFCSETCKGNFLNSEQNTKCSTCNSDPSNFKCETCNMSICDKCVIINWRHGTTYYFCKKSCNDEFDHSRDFESA